MLVVVYLLNKKLLKTCYVSKALWFNIGGIVCNLLQFYEKGLFIGFENNSWGGI